MKNYELTEEAKRDLLNIWIYTADTWSANQADRYYSKLIASFQLIAEKIGFAGLRYDNIYEGLFGYHIEKHIVFYLRKTDDSILIVRILHENMDYKRHL